jgi:hypothetical protein
MVDISANLIPEITGLWGKGEFRETPCHEGWKNITNNARPNTSTPLSSFLLLLIEVVIIFRGFDFEMQRVTKFWL